MWKNTVKQWNFCELAPGFCLTACLEDVRRFYLFHWKNLGSKSSLKRNCYQKRRAFTLRCLKGSLLLERIDFDTKGFILCKFQLRHHRAETTYENQSINVNDVVISPCWSVRVGRVWNHKHMRSNNTDRYICEWSQTMRKSLPNF